MAEVDSKLKHCNNDSQTAEKDGKSSLATAMASLSLADQARHRNGCDRVPSRSVCTDENKISNGATPQHFEEEEGDGDVKIFVDQDSSRPHWAWEKRLKFKLPHLRQVKQKELIEVGDLQTKGESPRSKKFLRCVCISDTHSRVEHTTMELPTDYARRVPDGDILLHAGDFTLHGEWGEVTRFNQFLGQLPHKFKFVISGNHETSFDPRFSASLALNNQGEPVEMESGLTNAVYLQDALVEFCGVKIYGLPWMPEYGSLGFGKHRGSGLLRIYDLVPPAVDVLLSHGPPVGIGDLTYRGHHVGCVELFNSVRKRIKPKVLVSGHIHEGYGIHRDGTTTYINAAVCNKYYKPVHAPIVFDLLLPEPFTVDDFHNLKRQDLKLILFNTASQLEM